MKCKLLISCMCVISILHVACLSYAQSQYDISVTVNGTTPTNPSGGCANLQTCFNIEGTYGNIVIERISGTAAARVEIPQGTTDGSSDTLRLINARIRSTAAAQTALIVFTRRFTTQPSGANTYYKLTANGTFSPESGNAFTAKGWYTNPINGVADQFPINALTFTVFCDQTGCTQIADKKGGKRYTPGTAERILKAELMVTLLQNGSTFSTGTGVKMAAPENPEGENVCPDCTPKAELNVFCRMMFSTAKTFGCPSCITDDGQVAEHAKVKLFAYTNWDNISQNMAQGQGEHLASLAALLNVPAKQQPAFFELAQGTYQTSAGAKTPEQVITSLHESWNKH